MSVYNERIIEKYNVIVENTLDVWKHLTMNSPLITFKLGKYTLINNQPTYKTTLSDAMAKKLISPATLKNIAEFIKIGFQFTDVYFTSRIISNAKLTTHGGSWISRLLKIVIVGKDPSGLDCAYTFKRGSWDGTKMYFIKNYGPVKDIYFDYASKKQIPLDVDGILKVFAPGAKITKLPNGMVDVEGNVKAYSSLRVGYRDIVLKDLPVRFRKVSGSFKLGQGYRDFANLDITKLPRIVGKDLELTLPEKNKSLKGGPEYVGGQVKLNDFEGPLDGFPKCKYAILNNLGTTNLKGLPTELENIFIYGCRLKSLEGMPAIKEVLMLDNIPVKTLEGCPEKIEGSFSLFNLDNLISLKGFPKYVSGNTAFSVKHLTKQMLLDIGIGSRVGGTIAWYDNYNIEILDKAFYTKEYVNTITKGSQDAGVNLDV